jgi:hypothetical protein
MVIRQQYNNLNYWNQDPYLFPTIIFIQGVEGICNKKPF